MANHGDVRKLVLDYASVWSPLDDEERRAFLERVWATDGEYSDPTVQVFGRDNFARHLAGFQTQYPGARFDCSNIHDHHGAVFFAWTMIMPTGIVALEGRTFGELSEGTLRFRRNVGFFAAPPQ